MGRGPGFAATPAAPVSATRADSLAVGGGAGGLGAGGASLSGMEDAARKVGGSASRWVGGAQALLEERPSESAIQGLPRRTSLRSSAGRPRIPTRRRRLDPLHAFAAPDAADLGPLAYGLAARVGAAGGDTDGTGGVWAA